MADNYQPVRDALPEILPPITREEATKAVKRLYRKFGKLDSGRQIKPYKVRRCWVSKVPTKGHWTGWGRLVHDVSHRIFRNVYPSKRPHDRLHSHYEAEIARHVAESGWLQGSLKPKDKPGQTAEEKRSERIDAARKALARWESKAKRADTAIRKYRKRIARLAVALERRVA